MQCLRNQAACLEGQPTRLADLVVVPVPHLTKLELQLLDLLLEVGNFARRLGLGRLGGKGTQFWSRTPIGTVQTKKPAGSFSKELNLRNPLMMRSLLILVAICFSETAFAQSAPPKVGKKSLVQVKPKEPMGCKLVGRSGAQSYGLVIAWGQSLGARQPRRKRKPCLGKRPEQSHPIRKSEN